MADNSDHSVPIRLIIELFQDLTVKYIKTMFGTNWSTFAVARVKTKLDSASFANSRANYSDSSGSIKSIIKLIQDLMFTYILTKFGAH